MNTKKNIKGKYLIMSGIVLFILGRLITYLFPNDIITLTLAVCAEISFFLFIGIGIIAVIREKREKKRVDKSDTTNRIRQGEKNNKIETIVGENLSETKRCEPKKPTSSYLNKLLKIVIIAGICILSIAVFYNYLYLPYKFRECSSVSEKNLLNKQAEIDKKIQETESERVEKNKDYENFLKDNPEPEKPKASTFGEWYNKEWRLRHSEYFNWESERDSLLKPVRELEAKISNLKKDLVAIEEEKKEKDSNCKSKYK